MPTQPLQAFEASREAHNFEVERQLILVRAGPYGGVDIGDPPGEQRLFVGNPALPGERCEHVRQSIRKQRRGAIHHMKMQMRCICVAAIAEQPEDLSLLDSVALLNFQTSRLHMGVERKAPVADIDDDVVAASHLDRRVFRKLAGDLFRQSSPKYS